MPTYRMLIVAASLAGVFSLPAVAQGQSPAVTPRALQDSTRCKDRYGEGIQVCRAFSTLCEFVAEKTGDSCLKYCEKRGGSCYRVVAGPCFTNGYYRCDQRQAQSLRTCICTLDRVPTQRPTPRPSQRPTTGKPTDFPSQKPTPLPTMLPTENPTDNPTDSPTRSPTTSPTHPPTLAPTQMPSSLPTTHPTENPTGQPTTAPTSSPSTLPTHQPTPTPTTLPTQRPTKSPTPAPTPTPPTPAPTGMPSTNAPSAMADYQKVCRKCERNGCFTSETSENRRKCENFRCSTMTYCLAYKFISSNITSTTTTDKRSGPSTTPSTPQSQFSEPPTSLPSILNTGMICSTDLECISGICRNGACMASADCYPVKHAYGTPFFRNTVNLVFVASAFESDVQWQKEVNRTYSVFKRYSMFDESIAQLNVFYVNPSVLDPSFCSYFCRGLPRLLCCDETIAQSLSSKCFQVGANLQTIVVHNDNKYGGAGYTYQNLATMSTHPGGALVAVHELGHSLFDLADEYQYGSGTDKDPNCSSSKNCSKWADLIKNTPQGYSKVKCEPGCKNGNYFVGGSSNMDVLSNPVGAVNTRYSCCTYQALTKTLPEYCNVFDLEPGYLVNFCKSNDFQNYGRSSYDTDQMQSIAAASQGKDSKFVYVNDPLLMRIQLKHGSKRGSKHRADVMDIRPGQPGLYRSNQVLGDFKKVGAAFANGVDSVVRIKAIYSNGFQVLVFNRNITIEIPSFPYGEGKTDFEEPKSVSKEVSVLNVVLNTGKRTLRRVKAKVLERK